MRKAAVMMMGVVALAGCGVESSSYDPPPSTLSERQINELAIDAAWENIGATDRQNICEGIAVFGVDMAVEMVLAETNEIEASVIRAKLTEECI
jgi:hypothetical protein